VSGLRGSRLARTTNEEGLTMTTTAHRPAPLPPRPGQPAAAVVRVPLPAGAVAMRRSYIDDRGVPQRSDFPVPVDIDDRRTAHIRYACRGHIELAGVKQDCDQVAWLASGENVRYCPDHGCQLTADGRAERASLLPWAQIRRAVEPSARPWWVLLAELAAGIGEYAGHVPWLVPLAASPALAAGAYAGTEKYLTRRAIRNQKLERGQKDGRRVETIRRRARAAAYMGAGSGAWLTAAASVDPATPVGAAALGGSLLALFAASAPTWWRYVEADRNRPEPAPAAEVRSVIAEAKPSADELNAAEAERAWMEEAGCPGTKLDVDTWRQIACGWQAVIVATKRGSLNNLGGDNMKATIRRIAAAFDVPKGAVTWIEEHDDSPNKALLLIQPNNPLKDGQIWAGPDSIDINKGVAEVGRLIDGTPMTEYLYRYGWGAPSAVSLGTTGGGKSMRARKRLVIERWTSYADPGTGEQRGMFLSFLHDPKRMESYAEFRRAVHGWGTSRDDAHLMIDAFLREMFRRYDMLSTLEWVDRKGRKRRGGVPWDPRVHGPIISAYWDEFHDRADDAEFVKKLEKLARYQRACGMRAELLSHMGTIGDTGSQALRDMLAGGRATLFRTTSGLNASLATGGQLTGDPRGLPKEPGMCYVSDGETATLMGRESFIPNDEDAERLGVRSLYDWMFDDDDNPIGFPAVIPAETAEAFGMEFMEWAEAGRRPGGRDLGPSGAASSSGSGSLETKGAVDALRQILFEADRPLKREQIATHALWKAGGWLVTSTLGAALTTLKKAGEVGGPHGLHELTPAVRERMRAERDEVAE
jgi:hypothetical protein